MIKTLCFIGVAIVIFTTVHAEDHLSEGSGVDYNSLAIKAMDINPNKNAVAVIDLLEQYKNDPKNENQGFHNLLGTAYSQQHRFDSAEESYSRALSLNANSAITHYNLGFNFIRRYSQEQKKIGYLENGLKHLIKAKENLESNTPLPNLDKWIDKVSKLYEAQ